ncbi:MAG TPA: PEP-CTERM sorting domain-containing protein [Phycisphaerae bacterium]|nr:PEP-CTERM sorting domain-containing protein [Phycisphaerae bacterium]
MRSLKLSLLWLLVLAIAPAAWGEVIGGPAAGPTGGESPPVTTANTTLIAGVPAYVWHHGCGPTAGGMILGYWDARGFVWLIPGSNDWDTNRQAIQDAIASPAHVADYALYDGVDDSSYAQPYPDRSEHALGPGHLPNSLADCMRASQSVRGMKYGWSTWDNQGTGLAEYARLCGYDSEMTQRGFASGLWDALVAAIDAGEPVELIVDSDGNGATDHFVTAIGYDDTPGDLRYAAYNTWDRDVHWYDYAEIDAGQAWGVYGGTFFRPVPEPTAGVVLVLGAMVALLRHRRRPKV